MTRRRLLVLVPALAGLVASLGAPAAAGHPGPAGCGKAWPVVTHRDGRAVRPAHAPEVCVTSTGYATSEPTLAVTPSGTVVMSPAQSENTSVRTTDRGRTWSLTAPAVEQYTSLWNTVDPSMTVDPRTGTVFLVHATGPTRTTPVLVDESPFPGAVSTTAAAAVGFQVYASRDGGRTWRTADYQTAPLGDWEKVVAGPSRSGRGTVVYVCGNSPLEVSGPGRLCYRSTDEGATFAPAGYVFPSAAQRGTCAPLAANAGAVGPDGTLYQPVTCSDASYVAVSSDEGTSYAWHAATGAPGAGTDLLGSSFQVAADSSGVLYAMWLQDDRLLVSSSHDRAAHWSRPVAAQAPGQHGIALPQLTAGRRGHVGIGYYAASTPGAAALTAWATQTADGSATRPTWTTAALSDPRHPAFVDGGLSGPSPRADYIGAAFGPDDRLWVAFVRQLGAARSDGTIATAGMVGSLR